MPGFPSSEFTTRRRKLLFRMLLLLSILACALLLVATLFLIRYHSNIHPGWQRMPLSNSWAFPQNITFWLKGRSYGEASIVEALEQATRRVQVHHPPFRIAYLDMSRAQGGSFSPHLSHRNGLDIDITYAGRDPQNRHFPNKPSLSKFAYWHYHYDRDGRLGDIVFDGETNWLFLIALRDLEGVRLKKAFVEPFIETWYLEAGRKLGASEEELHWAAQVLRYAGDNAAPHTDHIHLRFELL